MSGMLLTAVPFLGKIVPSPLEIVLLKADVRKSQEKSQVFDWIWDFGNRRSVETAAADHMQAEGDSGAHTDSAANLGNVTPRRTNVDTMNALPDVPSISAWFHMKPHRKRGPFSRVLL